MIQAAHFDIKTVTGLRQALVLSAEYENEPFPLEGYTLHGSIGTYPRMDLKCSVDENGRARIEWDSVPPGNWKYDVFLISASNDETPLMEGTFTALPRITPVLDDESVNDEVGGVLRLPSGNEGTITLEVDGGFVSKEYAAIAKDAADKAQQALEAIPEVDASGNMTLSGTITATAATINGPLVVNNPDGSGSDGTLNQIYGITRFYQSVDLRSGGWLRGTFMVETGILNISQGASFNCAGAATFSSAINANGGVNIPLAVGAPTATGGVNRLYAAGLAAVTDAFSVRCYPLLADCSSSNGTVFKTDKEPNSLYFNVPPNSAFTVKCGLVTNARPMHNYSSIRGWVAPLRLPAVSTKFTARFGQMTTVARMGRDRDAFTLVPDQAAGGYRIGEIIDITFDHVRDADAGGYHIRVREIYYSNAEQKWKMKTTQALAPETSSNTGYPVCVYAVVYEQYQDGGYDTEDRGALWLLHGGNSSRGCVKIATVKGVHCFESIYPFSGYYLDMENTNSWALAGAFLPATMHLHCNNVNPAYYGFSSMESNIIVSEAVEDFVDPEAETTTED